MPVTFVALMFAFRASDVLNRRLGGTLRIARGSGDAQHGFPYLSGAGRLVLKDIMLLAGALWVMADSARALLEDKSAAAPAEKPQGRVATAPAAST
jgi:uncharacterized membrane protein YkgB